MMSAKIFNTIVKPYSDNRNYRGLEMLNGMKVLLISDSSTDRAAAALNVNVGYMCDPEDIPGLAHFCEHMLFLGTDKYPKENEYSKFLCEHGGRFNAHTCPNNTSYFFDVDPDFLSQALDRFVQFFLCPLFTEDATDRELNAVHSEFEKSLQSDVHRLNQLEKWLSDLKHPYHKFSIGNRSTLEGEGVRQALLQFHQQWYSADIMALVILGKESLDELEEMIEPFSTIVKRGVTAPSWPDHPMGPDYVKLQALVVPVKDTRNLKLTFPVPDLHQHYRSNPSRYLGHLLGHEGPGSLLAELKARGWVSHLIAGFREGATGFGFFDVSTDLTLEGIGHTDEIIDLVFSYIAMLQEVGPQSWIFQEQKDLSNILFRFKDTEKPMPYVTTLSSNLHLYAMEEVISGGHLLHHFEPTLIKDLLDRLCPDNLRIALIGKQYATQVTSKEKWYGVKYSLSTIPEEKLQRWRAAQPHPKLVLPLPNEFISTDFTLVPPQENPAKWPIIIKNTQRLRLWYKQDDEYSMPKLAVRIKLCSGFMGHDPHKMVAAQLFTELFRDALNEYAYDAELAHSFYEIKAAKHFITLTIIGFNDKLPILLYKILDKLADFTVDPVRFDILKEERLRSFSNFEAAQPHQHCQYLESLVLGEHGCTKEELREAAHELKSQDIAGFLPAFCHRMHLEALFYGNLTAQDGLQLLSAVEASLDKVAAPLGGWKPPFSSQCLRKRWRCIPDRSSYVVHRVNIVHPCGAVLTELQCGPQSTRTNMLTQLCGQVTREAAFHTLRTQEQLGYIVTSHVSKHAGTISLHVLVQSDRELTLVDARIDAFLSTLQESLREMGLEEFENHKKSLELLRLEKPKYLYHQFVKYWTEVECGQYNFERDTIEMEYLRTLQLEDLCNFFDAHIAPGGCNRKKLAFYVLSETTHGKNISKENLPKDCQLAEDIWKLQESLGFYPLVPPFIDVNPPK